MSKNDGGPAFPAGNATDIFAGMSLREYYAGQALVGVLAANTDMPKAAKEDVERITAMICVAVADAMIAELEKTK